MLHCRFCLLYILVFCMTLHRPLYDVCLLLLYTVENDARTLNMARTLVKHGKSVCIVALGTEATRHKFAREGIDIVPLAGVTEGRFFWRWWDFARQLVPLLTGLKARQYWACEGYVLVFALVFSWLHTARLVYDSREIYSALGTVAGRPFVQGVISAVERCCMRFVDTLITSGDLDSAYLHEHFRRERHRQYQKNELPTTIMNLPPYKPVIEPRPNRIRERFGLSAETRIVLYQGMIFHGRGLLPVVRALPFVPNAVFVLFGEGTFSETVRRTAEECGVSDRVLLAGKIPYDELPFWTASADMGVAFIEPISLSYEFALPNKLFEYCMAGIPTLVSDLPALRAVLERHPIGVVANTHASAEQLATCINACLDHTIQTEFRLRCVAAAKEYSWEAQQQRIVEIASVE